jgi:MFS transporter, DHA1 family, multidrug resistance protein
MIVFPIGQLVFGWPAQAHAHWIVPQIGSVIFCFGVMLAFSATQGFLVDYCGARDLSQRRLTRFLNNTPGPEYGASAIAAAVLLRSISACVLPIFGDDLFRGLGWCVCLFDNR